MYVLLSLALQHCLQTPGACCSLRRPEPSDSQPWAERRSGTGTWGGNKECSSCLRKWSFFPLSARRLNALRDDFSQRKSRFENFSRVNITDVKTGLTDWRDAATHGRLSSHHLRFAFFADWPLDYFEEVSFRKVARGCFELFP